MTTYTYTVHCIIMYQEEQPCTDRAVAKSTIMSLWNRLPQNTATQYQVRTQPKKKKKKLEGAVLTFEATRRDGNEVLLSGYPSITPP